MTTASARPPIFEGGPFGGWLRSRSGDADWDFFPFGRRGRGYRVNEDEIARLRRLERLAMTLAFVASIAAAFILGALLPRPASAYAAGCACVVVALAAKLGFNAAVAWLLRRNPAAERPLTWAEQLELVAAVRLSLPRILLAVAIPIAMGVAMMAFSAITFFRAMADIDVELQWLRVISSFILVVIGIYYARKSVLIVRLYLDLAARRPASIR